MSLHVVSFEYDGTPWHGWQTQQDSLHLPAVADQCSSALAQVFNHAIPTNLVCAGRTDKGVHALGQVVHFHSHAPRSSRSVIHGTNRYLPKSIRARWHVELPDDALFNARYSALSRTYIYLFHHGEFGQGLRHNRYMSAKGRSLNVRAMQEALPCLLGRHDCSAFRSSYCQSKTPFRTIHSVEVVQNGALFFFVIRANAFLHHMVRSIAGTLYKIGTGEKQSDWMHHVLASKDHGLAGPSAPPHGLYLLGATYPEEWQLPEPVSTEEFLQNRWS